MNIQTLKPDMLVGLGTIAGRRKRTGDGLRKSTQDRGSDQNVANDIGGLIGEWGVITALEWSGEVTHDFFDCSKPVKAADAVYRPKVSPSTVRRLDAKALIAERKRRWFLLDIATANDPMAKGIDLFVPVLCYPGSAAVIIGSPIRPSDARKWEKVDLQRKGNYAYGLPIDRLLWDYFGKSSEEEIHAIFDAQPLDWSPMADAVATWGAALTPEEIIRIAAEPKTLHEGLLALGDWLGARREDA